MVLGIRSPTKRLASIGVTLKAQSVLLVTKAHEEDTIKETTELVRWMLSPEREVRYTVFVERNLYSNTMFNAQNLVDDLEGSCQSDVEVGERREEVRKRLKYWTDEMCQTRPHIFDFIITLGGDRVVLHASWLFQRIVPPVFGFALEGSGFLAKFEYRVFREILTRTIKDGATISLRLRARGTIMRSQKRKSAAMWLESGYEDNNQDNTLRDLVEELLDQEIAYAGTGTHWTDRTYEVLNDVIVGRGPNPSRYSFF